MNKHFFSTVLLACMTLFNSCKKDKASSNINADSSSPFNSKTDRYTGPNPEENFGSVVAMSTDGNTAIVGAVQNGLNNPGQAYIYARNGSDWAVHTTLVGTDPNTLNSDNITDQGISVGISGDGNTAVVGAQGSSGNSSTVFIFGKSGNTWSQQFIISKEEIYNSFQYIIECGRHNSYPDLNYNSIAISNDGKTVVVKATEYNSGISNILVFLKDLAGTWAFDAAIPVDPNPANYAVNVAINGNGNILAVTKSTPSATANYTGKVDVYNRLSTGWTNEAINIGPVDANASEFGRSLSISNDGETLVVGTLGEINKNGAVFVYERNSGNWSSNTMITTDINLDQINDIGNAVSITSAGNDLVIGATLRQQDDGLTIQRKNIILYYHKSDGSWIRQNDYAVDEKLNCVCGIDYAFGYSLAISGDGNTVLAGDAGAVNEGYPGHIIFFYK